MKDKIKYGNEMLDIEIPEGVDVKIMLQRARR